METIIVINRHQWPCFAIPICDSHQAWWFVTHLFDVTSVSSSCLPRYLGKPRHHSSWWTVVKISNQSIKACRHNTFLLLLHFQSQCERLNKWKLLRKLPWISKKKAYDTVGLMLPETRKLLDEFYRPFQEELHTMVRNGAFTLIKDVNTSIDS